MPAVGIQKGRKNITGREKPERGRRWDTGDRSGSANPTSYLHPQLILAPALRGQTSICGRNDPASRPCGQSRSWLIKMKWAADPRVPFRRVEHWPWDLYLIDQPVWGEKKFCSSREACSPLHCSISERNLGEKEWMSKFYNQTEHTYASKPATNKSLMEATGWNVLHNFECR